MASVLIVDDDKTIREMLFELLSEDHRCQSAKTADEALTLLEKETFDVLLTDISMPGLSGLELLEIMRQRYPQTPVIIISGAGDLDNAQNLISRGAFAYLLKPFRLETVEECVRKALTSAE
jgi:DNA-binding NtrC family response regulator